jgi:hypothetical protein
MKTILTITLYLLVLMPSASVAETKEFPFSLDDRDRIIRTEQKVESMNQRFEAIDKRFDQLFNFLWAITGIFTAMVISIFGFAFWDRKLALAPMKKENLRTLNALRDYAEHQPKLREILKNAGLL